MKIVRVWQESLTSLYLLIGNHCVRVVVVHDQLKELEGDMMHNALK